MADGSVQDYFSKHLAALRSPDNQGGTSGSYVGQTGGVSGGDRSAIQVLAGQNTSHVDPALQQSLPDAGDQAAYAAADAEYKSRHDAWQQQQDDLQREMLKHPFDSAKYVGMMKALPEPQKPDYTAIQSQSDRNRLLNEATSAYTPLISALGSAAQGNGPSQALNQYRIAADDAQRRAFGMAASSNGAGGQRSALMQAAIGKAAEGQQAAAGQAAAIGASEQQNARSALGQALTGLTNVYGTQLYGGTQAQQTANQNAMNNAIGLNEQTQQNNANNSTGLAKSVVGSAGSVLEKAYGQ